ncbi:hypothetical protein N0V83_005962 [Neocucurbitaria cava]|uniref:DUF2470 domain-containing protein n=1 Tax=Neocucurbitaria cava TaxID=798079 RepID=A0A9W9CLI7_9PLEO|nr:hypothetical protein N0V83_005962 [Neocucurbitaria cava]
MTTPEAQEAAAKQRIIRHMNADHHDSIRRYVEAYASKSMWQSSGAEMINIYLDHMIFLIGSHQIVIPFDPPMKSFREARERLVEMDKDALHVLGRSDISITAFIPPTVKMGHLFNFTQCLLAYMLLPRPANFRPGSLLYDGLLYRVPSFAAFVAQISWIVFAIMLPIHIFEAGLMGKKQEKEAKKH